MYKKEQFDISAISYISVCCKFCTFVCALKALDCTYRLWLLLLKS